MSGVEELAEVYQELMDSAGDSWYDVVNYKLFENNGNAFLHIFCWQVRGSFVVQVNVNASLGMNFEYINQKRYNYSVRVKAKTSTNQTIDLIPTQYNFDFYVVGMVGVRAGLRLEMYVGLFSLKLDKVGLVVDVGAYVQLWGYFYYHKEWTQAATSVKSGGALLIEVGVYLDIRFLAQVFNSSKLTFSPSLYNNQWPVWSAGARQNVYDFSVTDDTDYSFKTVKTLSLPSSTFRMKAMDLKTGQIGTQEGDDATESAFQITFTNKVFRYDAATNTVTVSPENGSLNETTQMRIVYKKAPLTFSSQAITKVLNLTWSDPEGMRYLAFNSMGGSAVQGLSAGSGAPITWPADPTREGYAFQGWFTDGRCTREYTGSRTTMPTFLPGYKGQTLYAKWTPVEQKYTVEHYYQNLDGTYPDQPQVETMTGLTGTRTQAKAQSLDGFTVKAFEQQTITPNDSKGNGGTVIRIYYDRKSYKLTFISEETKESQIQTVLFGEDIQAPRFGREGHNFTGWKPAIAEGATVDKDAEYKAQWERKTYGIVWSNNQSSLNEKYGTNYTDTINSKTGTYGTGLEIAENPEAPEVTGAQVEFMGWNTMPDGSGIMLDKSADNTVTGPVTYYAQWAVVWNEHTLTWKVDGADLPVSDDYTSGTVAYGTKITPPADPTKERTDGFTYTFMGWFTDKDGENKVTDFGTMVDQDVIYYGLFDKTTNQYKVVWKNEDTVVKEETLDYGKDITIPAEVPTKAEDVGYTYAFKQWVNGDTAWSSDDKVTGDVTYTATYMATPKKYTVTWDVNGGNPLTDGDYTSGLLDYGTPIKAPVPTRETVNGRDYVFTGWFTSDGTPVTDTVQGDVTYIARWTDKAQVLTVTFDPNGGELTGDATQDVEYDNAIILPSAPTRTGYTFVGWSESGKTDEWNFADKIRTSITLVAQWKINVYTITWKVPQSADITTEVEYNQLPVYPKNNGTPANYVKNGVTYTFMNWDKTVVKATEDTTYTAVFQDVKQCQISFNGNGNSVENISETVIAERDHLPPDVTPPTRPGYEFLGYYDKQTGGNQYYDKNGKGVKTWASSALTATLYANWREYTVTFNFNRNSNDTTVTQDGNKLVHAPYYEGYHFHSWNLAANGYGKTWTGDEVLTEDTTVYALWNKDDANATKYDIWIAGVQVTDNNKDYICADGISTNTGRIWYDPNTQTLTFEDHVEIEYEGTVLEHNISGSSGGLKIVFPDGTGNKLVNTKTDSAGVV